MKDELRADVGDELEAADSELCDCGAVENPPVSPVTRERMAHHCDCRAVLASEIVRRGLTRTLHAAACSPHSRHPGEPLDPKETRE